VKSKAIEGIEKLPMGGVDADADEEIDHCEEYKSAASAVLSFALANCGARQGAPSV
jgi:hypothetical protein